MTRAELAERLHDRHGGLSHREAREMVDLVLRLIRDRLVAGRRVEIAQFGTFEVRRTAPRGGRHPVTGRRFVARSPSLVFRPARALREIVNAPSGEIA